MVELGEFAAWARRPADGAVRGSRREQGGGAEKAEHEQGHREQGLIAEYAGERRDEPAR